MTISRMQNPQQLQGIGSLRQPYGLGKLVKKAVRGIKKVAKSPIGKAALLYAGTAGLGALAGGAGGTGFGWKMFAPRSIASNFGTLSRFLPGSKLGLSPAPGKPIGGFKGFAKKWLNPFNPKNPLLYSTVDGKQKFSGKKLFGLGAGAAIAAPFIQKALGAGPYAEEEEEEEEDWSLMPSSIGNIVNRAQNYYKQPTSYDDFQFMPDKQFVNPNFYGADGGVVSLANGGNPGEAQMEQMLRAEYMKYRNQGGTMPYEQFKILVMKQAQQGQTPNQMMEAGGRAGYRFGEAVEQETDLIEGPQGGEEFSETLMASHAGNDAWLEQRMEELMELGMSLEAAAAQAQKELRQGNVGPQDLNKGGRAGYQGGELVGQETDLIEGPQGGEEFQETVVEGQQQPSREQLEALAMHIFQLPLDDLDDQQLVVVYQAAMQGEPMEEAVQEEDVQFAANCGVMGDDDDDELTYNPYQAMSMYKRTGKQEGGLMDLGGQEKDYRDNGGFVALGGEERADDVPARLSKNEFVFTADAVRAAGGGDIDAGSEVMQNVMDNLEQGGEVSEDSQGLEGGEEIMSEEIIDESNPAQGMFDNYEQLQSRVA